MGALRPAQWVMEVTPYALFLTLAGWRRRADPGRLTALRGAEQQRKQTPKQQSTVNRRRVRAAGGRRGVYEYSKNNKIDFNFINCN